MLRLSIFGAVLSGFVAIAIVVGNNDDAFSISESLPPTLANVPGVDLIAFTDPEGRIGLIRPDGTSGVKISPQEGLFIWPTWSPDARRIAFSGFAPISESAPDTLNLYISELSSEEPAIPFTNKPGVGPILPSMPHYILWSPDSKRLSFMASDPLGLTLFIDSVEEARKPEGVVLGTPMYASWSTDSRYMVVHRNEDHFLVDASTGESVRDSTTRSISYRAPAWEPNSNRVTIVDGPFGAPNGIYSSSVENTESGRKLIGEYFGDVAFLWAPDGQNFAVSNSTVLGSATYETIEFYSPEGTRKPLKIEETTVAFFWSPDSSKLAYITLTEARTALRWKVLEISTGESWPLMDFEPSSEQITVFQYFDQFAYSHTPWSPDSKSLVFSGTLHTEGISASFGQQAEHGIYIVSVEPESTANRIADGVQGFWSPK